MAHRRDRGVVRRGDGIAAVTDYRAANDSVRRQRGDCVVVSAPDRRMPYGISSEEKAREAVAELIDDDQLEAVDGEGGDE